MSLSSPTGAEIKAFRAEFELSQARLSEVLGVSKRTVEVWEAEGNAPPGYLAFALAYLRGRPEIMGAVKKEAPTKPEQITKPRKAGAKPEAKVAPAAAPTKSPKLALPVGAPSATPGSRLKKR